MALEKEPKQRIRPLAAARRAAIRRRDDLVPATRPIEVGKKPRRPEVRDRERLRECPRERSKDPRGMDRQQGRIHHSEHKSVPTPERKRHESEKASQSKSTKKAAGKKQESSAPTTNKSHRGTAFSSSKSQPKSKVEANTPASVKKEQPNEPPKKASQAKPHKKNVAWREPVSLFLPRKKTCTYKVITRSARPEKYAVRRSRSVAEHPVSVKNPRLGQFIANTKFICVPRTKIILDVETDNLIWKAMTSAAGYPLTKGKFSKAVISGVFACRSRWKDRGQTVDEFWQAVGSSSTWLQQLDARIARNFFLKLCLLYEKGTSKQSSNEMLEGVQDLYYFFREKNAADLQRFRVDGVVAAEPARPAPARDNARVQSLGPVKNRLIPIEAFGAEKMKRRQEANRQMKEIGRDGVVPKRAPGTDKRPTPMMH
ncbi:hypothetical protein BD289DRAFT_456407 [Coniella lustricola]|uniref:Uncharacterized protein n=1 Tax=Coniella lustricola TaxID=2025994 RepID=A0A2T2ZVZ3_9PEZI|nr:hypothetical protein BD289DRAFT_456407 [Coniella lustricola]